MRHATLSLALIFSSCTCSEGNDSKLMPKPPPPPTVEVPADLHIPVEIDGRAAATIDKKMLSEHPPTFQNPEHRAWSIAALLGAEVADKDLEITVFGENDLAITMPRPKKDAEHEPVLMLSRRGELNAALVSPADPFPAFHGQGRRLERGGDPLPRLSGQVTRIRVVFAGQAKDKDKSDEREQTTEIPPLAVNIDGKAAEPWTYQKLAALIPAKKEGEPGVSRDTWSLRDAARALVGPKARVTALVNVDDERLELKKADWNDAARTPAMRVNRQGHFKFQWSGANPMLGGASELRRVRTVEITTER